MLVVQVNYASGLAGLGVYAEELVFLEVYADEMTGQRSMRTS